MVQSLVPGAFLRLHAYDLLQYVQQLHHLALVEVHVDGVAFVDQFAELEFDVLYVVALVDSNDLLD